jgi:hypothetical protein
MKKYLAFTIFCLAATFTFGQGVVKKLADETCDCMKAKDLDNATMEDLQMKLGMCMVEKAMPLNEQIKEELGIDLFAGGEAAGRELGEKVSFELAISCPTFQEKAMELMQAGGTTGTTKVAAAGQATGPIKEFKTDGFVNIILEGDGGRQLKFLWLRHFPGSEKLIGNMDAFVGKNVTIGFREIEVFLPQAGDYFKVKEIISLEQN